jgi:PEP-CTERM motif
MTFRIVAPLSAALLIALSASAEANPTATSSVFATGAPVGGTQPDSVTTGDGSVWIEYGNGAASDGSGVQHQYTIAGLVDGLMFNPTTGIVWALQNNDGNATLSLINPTTHVVSGPLSYAVTSTARGYDDVAFLGGNVYLSYTNPVNPTDSVLQRLNNGNNPTTTLTTTTILTASQTGVTSGPNEPDIDSLKSTPNGELVLTTEGDGPGCCDPVGEFTLIAHPGAANQTVTNVHVTTGGSDVQGIDDVIFPGATSGWLYAAETGANQVDKVWLTGLDPNTPLIAIGGLSEVALVNPSNGDVESTLLSRLTSPHGMDFVAAPEPSTWAMMLLGFAGLAFMGCRRAKPVVAA